MAELDIEDDLRALLASAAPSADADRFAVEVDERIARRARARVALVVALTVVGVLVAWLMLGLSPADLAWRGPTELSALAANAGVWALGLLALLALWAVVQAAATEA